MGERGVFVGEIESTRFGMIPEMPRVMRIKFSTISRFCGIWDDGFAVLDQSKVLREYIIEKCVAMCQLGFASRLGSSG